MSGSARARRLFPRPTLAVCALAAIAPVPAHGQASHQVGAEALFREARKLVDDGRYAEACEKFAASQRLEAAVGTLLNLGRCYEKIDRTATAWATYHEAIAVANATGQSEREKIAKERADSLEPALPRLTITVSPQASGAPLQVTRDGEAVLPELWGVTVPVDPGEHAIAASAPGKTPWASKIRVEPRQTAAVAVPMLGPDESAGAQILAAAARPGATEPLAAPEPGGDAPRGDWTSQKTVAVVLAGASAAGLVAATVEGLRVLGKKSEYDDICGGQACPEPNYSAAQALLAGAQKARTMAIVAGAAGGACFVGAAIFWLTADRSPAATGHLHVSPAADIGKVGVEVSGRW
jgi:hypothetical protein